MRLKDVSALIVIFLLIFVSGVSSGLRMKQDQLDEMTGQAYYLVGVVAELQDSISRLNLALKFQVQYARGLDGEDIIVLHRRVDQ